MVSHIVKFYLLITCVLLGLSAGRCRGKVAAYWNFNENTGLICNDQCAKSCAFIRRDILSEHKDFIKSMDGFGNCLFLDNSKRDFAKYPENEYLELSNNSVLNFGKKDFTITGWLKAKSQQGRSQFIISNSEPNNNFALYINDNVLAFYVKPHKKLTGSQVFVADDKWHFFAAGVNDEKLFLYIDGVKQNGTGICTDILSYEPMAGIPRGKGLIGADLTGCIDDLAVFDSVLSEEEILQIRRDSLKKFGFSPDAAAVQKCQPESSPFKVVERVAFDGYKGFVYKNITYRLACASIITQAPNDDLLVWCITGSESEPATDNSVLMVCSTDNGKTWQDPQMFIPATSEFMVVASNIYSLSDGNMVALWAYLPPEKKYTEWHYYRMYSADSGKTWSTPQSFPIRNNSVALFEGRPLKLANGEYFFAGSFFDKRKKPLTAPIQELLKAKTEEQAAAMPGNEGKTAGKFSTHLHGCDALISRREDAIGLKEAGAVANRPLGLLEPTCVQLKNKSIAMLMRGQFGGFLWRADSFDNGRTWTDAYKTDIPNPSSMAHLLRLPDDRILLIHNNNNIGRKRQPLSFWLSDDEMKTWYIKSDVLYGGMLAYPHAIILKNGKVVFVYDHNRRQIRFVEITLPPKHH